MINLVINEFGLLIPSYAAWVSETVDCTQQLLYANHFTGNSETFQKEKMYDGNDGIHVLG